MSESLESIFNAIDAANASDPRTVKVGDQHLPKELHYGQAMSRWLARLRPDAPEALQIAVRAQHIRRWEIPRDTFPMDRRGYLQWRRQLYVFHADTTAEILEELACPEELIERVRFLIQKRQLDKDLDTQTLEDCACLVFLEIDGEAFAQKTDFEKMVSIVRKTWRKMSPQAQGEALNMELSPALGKAVHAALNAADQEP